MRRRFLQFVLVSGCVRLLGPTAYAADPAALVERTQHAAASALWVRDASGVPSRVEVERSGNAVMTETVSLLANETARLDDKHAPDGRVRVTGDVVLVRAPLSFEPTELVLFRRDASHDDFSETPKWYVEAAAAAELPGGRLGVGDRASVTMLDLDPGVQRVRLAVRSLAPETSLDVHLTDAEGRHLACRSISAADTVGWQVALTDGASDSVPEKVVIETRSGEWSGALVGEGADGKVTWAPLVSTAYVGGGGSSSYSETYSSLSSSGFTFSVSGAPANACGDIYTKRNGTWRITTSWICTDSFGRATKGPWTCSTNQTDDPTYILWPDGSQTTNSRHVCDTSYPGNVFTAPPPGGVSSFAGDAQDTAWGTGFDMYQWSNFRNTFKNTTTGKYYSAVQGCYCSSSPIYFGAIVSPLAGFKVSWRASSLPPASTHVPGQYYEWRILYNDMFYANNNGIGFPY